MPYRIFLIILFFLFLSTFAFMPGRSSGTTPDVLAPCDLNHTSCTQSISGCQVTLDINPKPIPSMKNLTFTVVLAGGKPGATPFIKLEMPGMNMGPNQVNLKLMREATYQGKGVVVKCPSGRKTWRATVTLPSLGKADFVFDVLD